MVGDLHHGGLGWGAGRRHLHGGRLDGRQLEGWVAGLEVKQMKCLNILFNDNLNVF